VRRLTLSCDFRRVILYREHVAYTPLIPKSYDTLSTKKYSSSTDSKDEKVTKQPEDLEIEQVSGYVTCVHESVWWLACVLGKDLENAEVRLTLLHPHGPSRSYKYPTAPDITTLPLSSILTLVEPKTTTGRTYSLYQRDVDIANLTTIFTSQLFLVVT